MHQDLQCLRKYFTRPYQRAANSRYGWKGMCKWGVILRGKRKKLFRCLIDTVSERLRFCMLQCGTPPLLFAELPIEWRHPHSSIS